MRAARTRVTRRKASATERGLGAEHRADKASLLSQLRDGTPCPLTGECGGQPMVHPARCHGDPDGEDGRCFWCRLDRDHTIPRVYGGADSAGRLAHARCNRSAGAKLGNARRYSIPGGNSRRW